MEISPRNVVVALLTASAVLVGLWATAAPRSWYGDFPGLGRTWVSVDGPFNEHLARDVGNLDALETLDAVGQTVSLAGTSVLALWLMVSAARQEEVR